MFSRTQSAGIVPFALYPHRAELSFQPLLSSLNGQVQPACYCMRTLKEITRRVDLSPREKMHMHLFVAQHLHSIFRSAFSHVTVYLISEYGNSSCAGWSSACRSVSTHPPRSVNATGDSLQGWGNRLRAFPSRVYMWHACISQCK
jgi:hypothetical protein